MTITVTPLSDVTVVQDAVDTSINLFSAFDDPRTTGLIARFELYDTSLAGGIANVVLFDQPGAGAPLTVQNFQNYVADGDYVNSIIHRSVANFVVQGGGFVVNNSDTIVPQDLVNSPTTALDRVPVDSPVENEFSGDRSNTRGTIAMAKVGSDPDSATSQWFFNLSDNSTNLDAQNGGFTVFGETISASDLAVIDEIAKLPILTGNPNSLFGYLPLIVDLNNPPSTFTAENFVRYRSISISQASELTFRVISNSNPDAVSATIVNNQLVLDYQPNQTGTAEIVVRATNLFGDFVDDSFQVTIDDSQNPSDPSPTTPPPTTPPPTTPPPTTPLQATPGDDTLEGTDGNDVIDGLAGNDRINGIGGRDRLIGGKGNDTLLGGDAKDILLGKGGGDKLKGGSGNDRVDGNGGKDRVIGNGGNDKLFGGGGNDFLKGGSGRDELDGGGGNDTLVGGGDRDLFIVSKGRGSATIRRFKNRQDKLELKGVSFNDITIEQAGRNTLISAGRDALAVLQGINANTINAQDFV